MRNLKTILTKLSVAVVLVLTSLWVVAGAQADNGARVYLQPVQADPALLTVEVMAENVTNLYGLELHLKYDPAVLEAQDLKGDQDGLQIEPGALLPVDKGFVVANQMDQAEGKVTYAITLLNPAPAVNGAGSVARLSFKVLQDVASTITVEQVILVSVDLQTIPTQTTPLTIGTAPETVALNATTPPATESNFPWWLVAGIILGLGLIVVGAIIVFKNGYLSALQPNQTNPSRSSSRPSAFK
jgi:hypothetical protein